MPNRQPAYRSMQFVFKDNVLHYKGILQKMYRITSFVNKVSLELRVAVYFIFICDSKWVEFSKLSKDETNDYFFVFNYAVTRLIFVNNVKVSVTFLFK